jgi:hypothetical protein
MQLANSHTSRLVLVGALLTAGSITWQTGCKPSAEKKAAMEQRIRQEVDALFEKILDRQAQGQLTEALALTETGLATPQYAAHKARFFSEKIDLLLAQDKDAAAVDLEIAAWKTEPALAQGVTERIQNYYLQKNNHAAVLAWGKRLLALGPTLPSDLRRQVLGWRLNSALSLADQTAAKECVDEVLSLMKPEEAVALLQTSLGGLISGGDPDLALPLIARISEKYPSTPAFQQLVATLNLRVDLATANWQQFPEAFRACVAQLPDEPLAQLTRQACLPLQKNNRRDLVEKASEHIIFAAPAKTNSVNLASRLWVECGVAADKKLLPERLDALLKAGVSPVQVGNLFDRYFYEMVNDLDIIRSLCSLGERILSNCSDENTVNNLKVKIVDGAFIVENYDLAVQMLEKGIPGKDKLWHDMSLPKVKAHRALAQKNPREAVKYFREFMDCWINSKQEEEYDPTSGIAYSREWILGRNANRIANILDSIPDKAEADKAREEAKNYFRIAVKKAAVDAEATKLIKEETKDMGL